MLLAVLSICQLQNDLRPTPNDGKWNVAVQSHDHYRKYPNGTAVDYWKQPALDTIISKCRHHRSSRCFFFELVAGVFIGLSMRRISWTFKEAGPGVGSRKMRGFDSFQGLPMENATEHPEIYWHKFLEGGWNAAGTLGIFSYEALASKILKYVDDDRVQFVRGYYNESLNDELAAIARPALYVDIHCDLYSSAYTALDWMFRNRLIVPGTLIGYDDWAQGGPDGEQRAHREVMSKYGAVPQLHHKKRWSTIFMVMSIQGNARLWWD